MALSQDSKNAIRTAMASQLAANEVIDNLNNIDDALSATELGYLDGVTAGTVTASKALVVDASKDLATLRNITASGQVGVSGTGSFAAAIGTGTTSSFAVTINASVCVVTTESMTTVAGASQAITLTNSTIASTSAMLVSIIGGTCTNGTPDIRCVPGSGTATITIYNRHASAAFNGTFILSVMNIGSNT